MKKALLFIYFLLNILAIQAQNSQQLSGRWRNDNGTETTATWKENANTATTLSTYNEILRLRINIKFNGTIFTSGTDISLGDFQYSKNNGSWVTISSSSSNDFMYSTSTYVSHNATTTQQISSGTFIDGKIIQSSNSEKVRVYYNRQNSEIEYFISPTSRYDKGATYRFRINDSDLNPSNITYPILNPNANYCALLTVPTTTTSITYNKNDTAQALTATTGGSGLSWYTTATGGTGSTTAPIPNTSTLGNTSFWVASTNPCDESERKEIVVTVVESIPATHLHFDGINDYIRLPISLSSAISQGSSITIEYWFKGTNLQSAVRFQSSGSDFIVAGWGNSNPQFIVSTDGGTNGVSNGIESTIEDDTWHHIACVWKKNETFATYLDGTLQSSRSAANVNLPNIASATGYLGAYNASSEFLTGNLDDVRIWNIARSEAEINASKNCELQGTEIGLLAYYKFNQGNNSGSNAGTTTLTDTKGTNNGTLTNFALTGTTSNWLAGSHVNTGSTCTTLSTTNFNKSNSIKVYPNPTSNFVTIEASTMENASVQISDVSGRILVSKNISETTNTIDLSPLQNGVYIFKIKTQDGESVTKVIKQ